MTMKQNDSKARGSKMETKIVEKETLERAYGFQGVQAIIDHDKHGRLLVLDGFGGMDTLQGGAVRFRHGMVIRLKNTDTLSNLKNQNWNNHESLLSAVLQGCDDDRPVLDWSGSMVSKLAESIGL